MQELLHSEIIYFYFEGKEHCYTVEELKDGLWSNECAHELFKKLNDGPRIEKAPSVTEALEKLGSQHSALANAMLEAYGKVCWQEVEQFFGRLRDRKVYANRN